MEDLEVTSRAARPWLGRLARVAARGEDRVLIGRFGRHVAALVSPLADSKLPRPATPEHEQELGLAEARRRFSEVLDLVESHGVRVTLTWRGRPLAMLIPWHDFCELALFGAWQRRQPYSMPHCWGFRPDFPETIVVEAMPRRRGEGIRKAG